MAVRFVRRFTPDLALRDVQTRVAAAVAPPTAEAKLRTASFNAQYDATYRVAAPTGTVTITLPEPRFGARVRFFAETATGVSVVTAANASTAITTVGVYEYHSNGLAWYRL